MMRCFDFQGCSLCPFVCLSTLTSKDVLSVCLSLLLSVSVSVCLSVCLCLCLCLSVCLSVYLSLTHTHICTLRFAGITEVFQFCCIAFVCVVSDSAHVNGATCIFQLQRAVQTSRNPKITACKLAAVQSCLNNAYFRFSTGCLPLINGGCKVWRSCDILWVKTSLFS